MNCIENTTGSMTNYTHIMVKIPEVPLSSSVELKDDQRVVKYLPKHPPKCLTFLGSSCKSIGGCYIAAQNTPEFPQTFVVKLK